MKIYFDLAKKCLKEVDTENQVIFTGDVLVSKLEVISSAPTTDYYVVVSAKLSNGRTIGPFLYDAGGVESDSHCTKWTFTLSSANGFTLTKGIVNFYVWLVPVNANDLNKKCIGAVAVNVGEAYGFEDSYFVELDSESSDVIANMSAQIHQLQTLIQNVNIIEPNPSSEATTDLNTIKIGSVTYRITQFQKFSENDTFGEVIDEFLENDAPPFTAIRQANLICEETGAFIHLEGYQSGADTYVEIYIFGSDIAHLICKNPNSTTLNFTMENVIERRYGATDIYTLDDAFEEIADINSKIPRNASSDNLLVDAALFNSLKAIVDKLGFNNSTNWFTPTNTFRFINSGVFLGKDNTYMVNNGAAFLLYDFLINEFTKINQKIPSDASSSNKMATASDVNAINEKIPSEASSSNKLADKNYVNDQINSVSAYYITKNAQGDAFASVSELTGATTYYSGGVVRVPTRNDYAIVLDDANHDDATTRYSYQGSQWEYQYTINEAPLTQPQLNALNSGVTDTKVGQYDNHLINTNNPHQVTKAQVGLGNVDNTSDADKPISNATQQALNNKADLVDGKLPVSQLPATGVTVDIARALAVGSTGTITGDKVVEDFDKNFYNMGAYDTKSGNTITRQTGYLKLDGTQTPLSSYMGRDVLQVAYLLPNCIQLTNSSATLETNVIANLKRDTADALYLGNVTQCSGYRDTVDNNLFIITVENCTTLEQVNTYLSQNNVVVQYKTSTSYPDPVITNQPLNTLDQKGSQWLRDEWLKGLNLFDGKFAQGFYSGTTGNFINSNTFISNKDKIKVKPNTKYTLTISYINATAYLDGVGCYDTNGNFISYINIGSRNSVHFPTPNNCEYIIFNIYNANAPITPSDINNVMFNEGDHPYPHQPYNKSAHITNEEAQFVEDELDRVSSEGAIVHKQELDDKLGNISSVDTGNANVINVLANSERAKLLELSSLSHKSKNKFVFDDIAQTTTASGLTYDMTDGVLTVNGTTTASTSIVIPLRVPIASGTYNIGTTSSGLISDLSGFANVFNTNADGSGTDFSLFTYFSNDFSVTNTGKSLKLSINNGVTCTNWKLRYSLYDTSEVTPSYAEDFEKGSLDLFNSLPTGIRSVGSNLWKYGDISVTANNSTYTNEFKDLILNAGTYTIKANNVSGEISHLYVTDASSGATILDVTPTTATSFTLSSTTNCRFYWYASLNVAITNTSTYSNIMLNEGSTALPYEPYKEAYIPLVLPEKYAWGINDNCKNKIVWDKDKGIGTPIVNRVDLGSLNWIYSSGFFYVLISNAKSSTINLLCSLYEAVIEQSGTNLNDMQMSIDSDAYLQIKNSNYTDATAFKTAMSGVYLYYEVASVTQEELAPLPNFMVEKGGTITIENPLNQDKGYKVMYYLDWINEQLQEAINEADTLVLLWENGSPNSAFNSGTLNINSSAYKYLIIEYAYYRGWKNTRFVKVGKLANPNAEYNSFTIFDGNVSASEIVSRVFQISDSAVACENCVSTTTTNNDLIVPIRIYGTNIL